MSIATELRRQEGGKRRYVLAIEGYNAYFFSGADALPSWTGPSLYRALRPPAEKSLELDLGEMKAGMSQQTFELDDIIQSDGTSLFGQLFAPARWEGGTFARVSPATAPHTYIDADATTIPIKAISDLPASGEAFLGPQAIAYTGSTSTSLTGVTMGKYSEVGAPGSTYGMTVLRPRDTDADYLPAVSVRRTTWLGARVALYVIVLEPATQTWSNEAGMRSSGLLWHGRISNDIQYDPRKACWKLVCTSTLEEFSRNKVGPEKEVPLKFINLSGSDVESFRQIWFEAFSPSGGAPTKVTITVSADTYSILGGTSSTSIQKHIQSKLDSAGWGGTTYGLKVELKNNGNGTFTFRFVSGQSTAPAWGQAGWRVVLHSGWHLGTVLGFSNAEYEVTTVEDESGNYIAEIDGSTFYVSYHPLQNIYNGSALYADPCSELWADQGDDSTAGAWVAIDKCQFPDGGIDGRVLVHYSSRSAQDGETPIYSKIVLDRMYTISSQATATLQAAGGSSALGAFVGQKWGDEPVWVRQVYVPTCKRGDGVTKGPYRILLEILLSSGTSGYNHSTYDVLPAEMAGRINSALVDAQSFLDADAKVWATGLADRSMYVIDKSTAIQELIGREAKLFGMPVVERNGLFTVVDVMYPAVDRWVIQLDDTNTAVPDEKPVVDTGIDTVINQYECRLSFDVFAGKYGQVIDIRSADSVASYGTKKVVLEHPGVTVPQTTMLKPLLEHTLKTRMLWEPQPVLTRTLAPYLIDRFWPGDVVKYVSSHVYDPTGSGLKSTSGYAIVLKLPWNLSSTTGSCTLLLLSQFTGYGDPWSPSARVNRTATNGGWDAATYRLTLVAVAFGESGDNDDGSAVAPDGGEELLIIESAPIDPTAAQSWRVSAASAYETDGAQILTLDAVTLTGWDATKEYVVTFAPRDVVVASQTSIGTWQADPDTEKLNSNAAAAQRWG